MAVQERPERPYELVDARGLRVGDFFLPESGLPVRITEILDRDGAFEISGLRTPTGSLHTYTVALDAKIPRVPGSVAWPVDEPQETP